MVRVRFAPSPTGQLHVGNVRTAMFNWLYAKGRDGKFILRIEDTDIVRSKVDYERSIIEDLRWLGITWDEGPDVGGDCGPYRQSERLDIYRNYAKKLLDEGKAYYCYCTPAELESKRKDALAKALPPKYDNRCMDLTLEERERFEREKRKPALRFKVTPKTVKVKDLIRGEVVFDTGLLGDIVIMKSDGMPTFIFAVTLDDYLMKITHVMRGEDHLSNVPKQILLFEALGYQPPEFAHLSMVLAPGGKRFSKREAAMGVDWYRHKGYLPEAVLNYIALLGWSSPSGKEIMPLSEMAKEFDFANVSKHAASLDPHKLDWVSGEYIRRADLNRLVDLAMPYLKKKGFLEGEITERKRAWLLKVVDAVRDHISCISQITDYVEVFFGEDVKKDADAKKILKDEAAARVLSSFREQISSLDSLDEDNFKGIAKKVKEKTGASGPALYQPLRAALSGSLSGPELLKVAPILGKEVCIKRIEKALEVM